MMKTSVIEVRDMLSVLSVEGVEERIGAVPGVESVTVNFAAGTATVRYDETRLHVSDIKSDVRQSGYQREAASTAPTAPKSGAPEAGKSKTTAPPAIAEAPAAITQRATPVPPAVAAASGTAKKAGVEVQPTPEAPPSPPAPAESKSGPESSAAGPAATVSDAPPAEDQSEAEPGALSKVAAWVKDVVGSDDKSPPVPSGEPLKTPAGAPTADAGTPATAPMSRSTAPAAGAHAGHAGGAKDAKGASGAMPANMAFEMGHGGKDLQPDKPFWNQPIDEALGRIGTTSKGLSAAEALGRLKQFAASRLVPKKRTDTLALLLGQFSSPIVLMLVGASVISVFLHDTVDAVIILVIVLASGLLGFWQERGAAGAVEKLLSLVEVKTKVLRDGAPIEIPVSDVVPGDVVVLSAGATAPGDCLLLESRDLFADEATLTGETFPAEKAVAVLPADTPLAKRTNFVFLGTHVVSGTGTALVVAIGKDTEFGKVSERLKLRPPETDFERGVRRFGYLLMEVTLLLVIGIFAFNVYLHRPVLDSFLFSMALAVGLTPQLLPAIVSINLASGARRMAEKKVIVKRLSSIENFGSMNVLCTDKTGTITEGKVKLQSVNDLDGKESERCLLYVYLNAAFETGFASPIDAAVRDHRAIDITAWKKLDEVPYDFLRKRLTVLVSGPDGNVMITKGALAQVLDVCGTAEGADGTEQPIQSARQQIEDRFAEYSRNGQRTLGLACKKLGATSTIGKVDETGMCFMGFVLFSDPLKSGIAATIERLRGLGVSLKVITGDNVLVAASVAREIGFDGAEVLSGAELKAMSDGALLNRVGKVNVFAEVEPNEKERIIRALRKAGNVVGYMGDGINDASALHAADVGLSVESAVDVAKEVADIVLLEKNLDVLIDGVREGRITFANTLKYVLIATSANFGNMFSMAGASLLLPFLPLLPKQILLTNMLTDLPAMTISSDGVDEEMLVRPRRWDIGFIRSFMLTFGVLSSVFDYLTFAVLLYLFHADTNQFRTAWFVESVLSASLILLVVRSRRPFFHSAPSRRLLLATLGVGMVTLALPYLPFAALLGLVPLPLEYLGATAVIVALYIASGELAKHLFYRRFDRAPAPEK